MEPTHTTAPLVEDMKHGLGEPRQFIPPAVLLPARFGFKEHAVADDVHVGRERVVELLPAHLLDHVRDARGEDEEGHLGALCV